MVDLDSKKAYWIDFDVKKTSQTTTGWSIVVPRENVLNKQSKPKIKSLAGEVVDYMDQIEYQWEVSNKIKESGLSILFIDRDFIESGDVSPFEELRNRLTQNDEIVKKARGKITFLLEGYNDDPREIYEIPEVRIWTHKILPIFKYWAYFMNMDEPLNRYAGIRFLHFCYVDFEIKKRDQQAEKVHIEFNIAQTGELANLLFGWLNELTDQFQLTDKINREQSELLKKVLFGDLLDKK